MTVYALGSPFGIDRLAWSVLEYMSGSATGTPTAIKTVEYLNGCDAMLPMWNRSVENDVMVIDTLIDPKSRSFSVQRLTPEQLAGTGGSLSGHRLALSETLALADSLGILPANLMVCGICVPKTTVPHPPEAVVAEIAAALLPYLQTLEAPLEPAH